VDINNTEEIEKLWKERLRLDGKAKCFRKAKEELAELSVAIAHFEDGKGSMVDVMDEVADVHMQLEKLFYLVSDKNKKIYLKQRQKKYNMLESMTYET
jgi:hypothetical protein